MAIKMPKDPNKVKNALLQVSKAVERTDAEIRKGTPKLWYGGILPHPKDFGL